MCTICLLTPRKIFLDESKPAAYMRAVYGGLRSHTTLQAKREIVLGAMEGSSHSFPPPEVSVTTKSMGPSVERPICRGTGGAAFTNDTTQKDKELLHQN